MIDDPTLLRRYAAERSEAAFAEFVARHLPLVYAAATRRLGGDTHRAEDVAQVVFCAVARDAHRLAQHAELTGWLYTATRNAVVDVIRSESRRRAREEEAHTMHENSSATGTPADWTRLRPVLDAAMDELSDDDRAAVLLRFFQGRPFAEIGAVLRLSEDTARKRVERAVEKLRGLLGRKGIASTSAALATLLATETLAAAPASLAASITGAAIATGGAAAGAATFFAMTKLQLGLAAVVVASGAAGLITQQQSIATLRQSNATLAADLTHQATENARLTQTVATAAAERTQLTAEVASLKTAVAAATTAVRPAANTPAPRSATTGLALAASTAVTSAATGRASSNPARLAQYHKRFDGFVQQRGLTPEQADKLFEILGEWDDVSRDFQASIRAQGLVWTPEAQQMRNNLQQKIEVEPLVALLGEQGKEAYFDYEGSSFYRAMVGPFAEALARDNLPLTDAETEKLIALTKSNLRRIKPDPSSMGSEIVVDWDKVVAGASGFLEPSQVATMRELATQLNRHK